MKSAFFQTLAVTALAVAAAVPAAAQFDVLYDISTADALAAAPPRLDAGAGTVTVRMVAHKTAAGNALVGDLQILVFYNSAQVAAGAPIVTVPGIHTAYAAVISSAPTADGSNLDGNAETDSYRTLLVSFNPTNAPLNFGGVIGDSAPVVALTFTTSATFDPAVDSFSFGTANPASFPSGFRRSTPTPAPVYTTNAVTADTATFVSYNVAADSDGDGVANASEDEFGPLNIFMWDTDSDGLSDGFESLSAANGGPGTNPEETDTDNDGVIDGVEYRLRAAGAVDSLAALYDPTVANTPTDTDADGLPDAVDPGAGANFDDPGGTDDPITDAFEYASGTNANDESSAPELSDFNLDGAHDFSDLFIALNYVNSVTDITTTPNIRSGNMSTSGAGDPSLSFTDLFLGLNYVNAVTPAVR